MMGVEEERAYKEPTLNYFISAFLAEVKRVTIFNVLAFP